MVNEIRIQKLQNQIRARVAEILQHELSDPRLGFVTISRVKLDREIQDCKIYWSVLGDDKERRRNEAALQHATGFVRKEIARVLHTRTVPAVQFVFDESIEGAIRISGILNDLREERGGSDEGESSET